MAADQDPLGKRKSRRRTPSSFPRRWLGKDPRLELVWAISEAITTWCDRYPLAKAEVADTLRLIAEWIETEEELEKLESGPATESTEEG